MLKSQYTVSAKGRKVNHDDLKVLFFNVLILLFLQFPCILPGKGGFPELFSGNSLHEFPVKIYSVFVLFLFRY